MGQMDRDQFTGDLRTQRAVELLIVIIGEAATQVSAETRGALPVLPWRQITAMRNRLVHHYFKIDLDLVWDVVSNNGQWTINWHGQFAICNLHFAIGSPGSHEGNLRVGEASGLPVRLVTSVSPLVY